ncbi:MAG: glucose-1-phosphate adenylyltransferase [Firmicutes bacterium]|nr:glucose-1-phosphate adenylyltransferase [Bacillota bacterium]
MRNRKKCIAMLLAGGQGSRLGALTKKIAKPAVSFGGKYRIIDFSLSNCANSHIDTVGVLTQYRPYKLNSYIGTGSAWDLDAKDGGIAILPPYATEEGGSWYRGTADAIYRNLDYIAQYDPEYVLILSGDHLYRMDYQKMIRFHENENADLTVSVMRVPMEEASRFGIMTTDEKGRILRFAEKPKKPESDLASMGIYVFKTDVLRKALLEDAADEDSDHDFGKNVIPKLLEEGKRLFAYRFSGFWRDVGTIDSYHSMSMELLDENSDFQLYSETSPIMSNDNISPPQYIGPDAKVESCLIANGADVRGTVIHSIVGLDATVEEGAFVKDSVLLPGSVVRKNAVVNRAIVGERSVVTEGGVFGSADPAEKIVVSADGQTVPTHKQGKE